MAVLAQYQAPAPPGFAADSLIQGLNAGQSLMERKQAMALRQQQADQQHAEFVAKLPLINAQTRLTTLNADAAIKNATDITHWEAQAATDSVTANKEFIDAVSYNAANDIEAATVSDGTEEGDAAAAEDSARQAEQGKYATQQTLDIRSQKLAALSAKYSYMKNLPEYKGFIARVDAEASAAHVAAASNLKLDELMQAAQARADASRYTADTNLAGKLDKNATTRADTQERNATNLQREEIRAGNRLDVEKLKGQNSTQREGSIIQNLTDRAAGAEQDAADATRAGDEPAAAAFRDTAARLRDAITKRSTYAGGTPTPAAEKSNLALHRPAAADTSAPAGVSVSIPGSGLPDSGGGAQPAAAPVAPTKVDAKATSVSIGGKTYPIFKDKHGNRAYLVDGHYVPIDTQ